jgi:NhaP-type Na+/H+ or K+/H+ antiporter
VFATVGAAVQFKNINMGSFGKGVGIIMLGLVMRWIGTVIAASEPKFVFKEKAFLGFAWIPKATV